MEDTDVTVGANGKEVEHLQAEILSFGFGGFYFKTGSLVILWQSACFNPLSAGIRSVCPHAALNSRAVSLLSMHSASEPSPALYFLRPAY